MKLEISPQVIESYKRLDYTHWHALAELVDNSTYWYELNRETILAHDPDALKCEVRITYNSETSLLRIADNSIGMDLETLKSAMVIGKKTNRPGRSVYGMGLKTACIWMGRVFTVKTKKAGLTTGYEVTVDYDKIMGGEFELGFKEFPNCNPNEHYTVIEVSQLDEVIQKRRLSKIKEYLSSIYREDFRDKKLSLSFNEEAIDWSDDNHYLFLKDASGAIYKRSFEFDIEGKTAKGWIGIMEKGGKSIGGLTILQNKRVIRGFPDTWKPEGLFGGGGEGLTTSLASQRLAGEIHLDGFDVTHTKDNIKWSGQQEEILTQKLSETYNDYKKEASKFKRNKESPADYTPTEIDEAIDIVTDITNSAPFVDAVQQIPVSINKDPKVTDNIYIPEIQKTVAENRATFECPIGGVTVRVFLKQNSAAEIYLDYETGAAGDVINMTINLSHPYLAASKPHLEQYILGCIYDAVAEYFCNKQTSVIHARTIREIKNNLMKTSIKLAENAT
jgi:hypothetical protein